MIATSLLVQVEHDTGVLNIVFVFIIHYLCKTIYICSICLICTTAFLNSHPSIHTGIKLFDTGLL